ncbi:MAG: hypothetical protein V3V97_02105 [Hyphomicrobiaceae bacterium]
MKYVSVIQHTQSEWLGLIEDHLEGRRIRFGYSRPFTPGGRLPDADVMGDGLILLGGGAWGANGGRQLPTFEEEVRLARSCLMLERPVIGIGLGAQILAVAGDGQAEPGPLVFEVGTARRVKNEALNGFLPATFPNVVYMRGTPIPPNYAQVLAEDEQGRPALWQIGSRAFGFSGHPGVKRAMIEDLIMEFGDDCPRDPAGGLEALVARKVEIEDALVAIMTGLIQLTGWMREDRAETDAS